MKRTLIIALLLACSCRAQDAASWWGALAADAAATPFSPLSISDCVLWLDGADASSATLSGDTILVWRDKSPQQNHAGSESGTTKYSANGLSFSGSSSMTGLTFIANRPITIVEVHNNPSSTMNEVVFINGSGAGGIGIELNVSGSDVLLFAAQGRVNYRDTVTNATIISSNVGTGTYCATWQNGSFISSQLFNPVDSSGKYKLGVRAAGAPYSGYVKEIIVFQRGLETDERERIEDYLGAKWGVVISR